MEYTIAARRFCPVLRILCFNFDNGPVDIEQAAFKIKRVLKTIRHPNNTYFYSIKIPFPYIFSNLMAFKNHIS